MRLSASSNRLLQEDEDEYSERYYDELYDVIAELKAGFRKYNLHIYVSEKNGYVRDEVIQLWDGGIFLPLFGYCVSVDTYSKKGLLKYDWVRDACNRFRRFIRYKVDKGIIPMREGETLQEYSDRSERRWWKGICHISEKTGLLKFVNDRKADKINRVFQEVCKRHPNLIDSIIRDLDCYPCIRPSKWGDTDGEKIHKKFWKNC